MNLEKIKPTVALSAILSVGNVLTIALAFFLLNRNLFLSLNLWQLIVIATGIAIPILLVNMYLTTYDVKTEEIGEVDQLFGITGGVSLVILNLFLVPFYYFKASLSAYFFTIFFFETGAGIILTLLVQGLKIKKQKRNQVS